MLLAYTVTGIVLALGLVGSAAATLAKQEKITANLRAVGVGAGLAAALAVCEIAGGVGLVAGRMLPWLGIAAAAGLVLYFTGAVAAHIRAKAWDLAPAAVFLTLAATTLALRLSA